MYLLYCRSVQKLQAGYIDLCFRYLETLCSGFAVLALHFQLLTEGSQGFVFGARGVTWLTPVTVVYMNHCCCFTSGLCLSYTVCLQVKATRRVSSMGQDTEVACLSLITKCLSSVGLTVALFSSLAGWVYLSFFPKATSPAH